jgi:hypothetical protein
MSRYTHTQRHVYRSMFTLCLASESTLENGRGLMLLFFLKLKNAKLSDLKFWLILFSLQFSSQPNLVYGWVMIVLMLLGSICISPSAWWENWGNEKNCSLMIGFPLFWLLKSWVFPWIKLYSCVRNGWNNEFQWKHMLKNGDH